MITTRRSRTSCSPLEVPGCVPSLPPFAAPSPPPPVLIKDRSSQQHAFKFFPTIGSLVLDRFKNTLLPELATRFSFQNRGGDVGADLRAGLGDGRKLLKVGELCVRGDLKCGLAEKLEIEKLESAGSRARL